MIKIVYLNKKVLYLNPSEHFKWMTENCPTEIIKGYLDELEGRKILIRNQRKEIHNISEKNNKLRKTITKLKVKK